jgi:hypothetical protein
MQTFGAQVALLTELDDESRRLYGAAVPPHQAPTVEAVRAAMARLNEGMRAARAAGRRTVFYFLYAGHGDAEEGGEGYVALAGGRLSRSDFETTVLAAAPADASHVVVDACRSYLFVFDRGAGGTRRPFKQRYFASGAAARFPHTGFLLSASSGAPSHEWEEFQAGVFSHEVRSALLGAADVDGDDRVSYREMAAFLDVANQGVRNERYRPAFVVSPPLEGDGTLLDLSEAKGGELRLPPSTAGRQLLEDPLGVRWADLHPSARQALKLRMPAPPWSSASFFLRRLRDDSEYRIPGGSHLSAADLTFERSATLRRGAAHEAFTQLFAVPFDGGALPPLVLESAATDQAAPPASPLRRAGWITVGAGAASLVVAGVVVAHALSLRNDAATGEARVALNRRIDSHNRWAAIGLVGGLVLTGTGVALIAAGSRSDREGVVPSLTFGPDRILAGVTLRR